MHAGAAGPATNVAGSDDASRRKCTGIEPAEPLLSQGTIGFEDQARHQPRKHFRGGFWGKGAGITSGNRGRYFTALGETHSRRTGSLSQGTRSA